MHATQPSRPPAAARIIIIAGVDNDQAHHALGRNSRDFTFVSLDELASAIHTNGTKGRQREETIEIALTIVDSLIAEGKRVALVGIHSNREVAHLATQLDPNQLLKILVSPSSVRANKVGRSTYDLVVTADDQEAILEQLFAPPTIQRTKRTIKNNSGELFLGIDVGATSTKALLIDKSGSPVASAIGEGVANFGFRHGVSTVLNQLVQTVSPTAIIGVVIGMTGHNPTATTECQAALKQYGIVAPMHANNDVVIVLPTATPAPSGLVIISGTGSNVALVDNHEIVRRAGGYGTSFGDTGSATYLGIEAVKAVVFAEDGRGKQTQLKQLLMEHFSEIDWPKDSSQILHLLTNRMYQRPRPHFNRLAPLVNRAAQDDDSVAQAIIEASAQGLADAARAVAGNRKLKSIALTGSVADPGQPSGNSLVRALNNQWPSAEVHWSKSAEAGAAYWALEMHSDLTPRRAREVWTNVTTQAAIESISLP